MFAGVGERVHRLAMEVRGFELVAVDEAQRSDTGAREIEHHRDAEAAAAYHQGPCWLQLRLPLSPTSFSVIWRE